MGCNSSKATGGKSRSLCACGHVSALAKSAVAAVIVRLFYVLLFHPMRCWIQRKPLGGCSSEAMANAVAVVVVAAAAAVPIPVPW